MGTPGLKPGPLLRFRAMPPRQTIVEARGLEKSFGDEDRDGAGAGGQVPDPNDVFAKALKAVEKGAISPAQMGEVNFYVNRGQALPEPLARAIEATG